MTQEHDSQVCGSKPGEPIDAVFTWVDGADPAHRAKLLRYLGQADATTLHPGGAEATRFNQADELWYALNSVRRFLPWLRTIFLVTDNQRPKWLTDALRDQLEIVVVDHREIFSGYEDVLPVFNSRSIEAVLHRIPGIGRRFIVFNDDVFVLRHLAPEYFFVDDRPVIRGQWVVSNRFLKNFLRRIGYRKTTKKGLNGVQKVTTDPGRFLRTVHFRLAHAPHPVNRDQYANLFGSAQELRSVIAYRFRGARQPWPIGVYANRELRRGRAIATNQGWEYVPPPEKLFGSVKALLDWLQTVNAPTVCIQSLEQHSVEDRDRIVGFLEQRLAHSGG